MASPTTSRPDLDLLEEALTLATVRADVVVAAEHATLAEQVTGGLALTARRDRPDLCRALHALTGSQARAVSRIRLAARALDHEDRPTVLAGLDAAAACLAEAATEAAGADDESVALALRETSRLLGVARRRVRAAALTLTASEEPFDA